MNTYTCPTSNWFTVQFTDRDVEQISRCFEAIMEHFETARRVPGATAQMLQLRDNFRLQVQRIQRRRDENPEPEAELFGVDGQVRRAPTPRFEPFAEDFGRLEARANAREGRVTTQQRHERATRQAEERLRLAARRGR